MGSKIVGLTFCVTKKARMINLNSMRSRTLYPQARKGSTHSSPFEPSVLSEEPVSASRLGILTKSLADDFQVIAGRESPVERISGLYMPYRSTGSIPQVMLQDKLLDVEFSLTFSDQK